MTIEVELKFALAGLSEVDVLRERFAAVGAEPHETIEQRDIYFEHPNRDFAKTDEAFRMRCVGEQNFLTYKGPLLDAVTKTRREIELATAPGHLAAKQLTEMLTALGFRPVREVAKRRSPYLVKWHSRQVELVLDDVVGLGWFLELETLADEADHDGARECLFDLSRQLRLGKSERRSYLRLLLEKDGTAP
jgi:adenylate cyclase class 2